MIEAIDLEDARNKAQPGEYIMVRPVQNTNPEWCVMSAAERERTPLTGWHNWETWEKKDGNC